MSSTNIEPLTRVHMVPLRRAFEAAQVQEDQGGHQDYP